MSDPNDKSQSEQNGHSGQESPHGSSRPIGIPDELLNMVGASPPRFVNFEQLMSAADGMKNMTLAHEIAVNNDFELNKEEVPENSLEKQVRDTVHRAFWDAFQEKLEKDPPDLSMARTMLDDLKETLLSILLPQHQRIKEQINEVLDMELIGQQMENGAFDFEFYGKYVTDTMARLCAPARDENIAQIRAITEVVPKFKAIMETLRLMRRDMANFTIKQIRPYIQQNSIEYERKKFAEYFEAQRALGVNALECTEIWLKRNYDKLLQATSEAQSSTEDASKPLPTPANIMCEAYLEVLQWPDPKNFPETLMIDQFRFMGMRDRLHTLGLITSVQLVTYSVVGPAVDGVTDLKQKLKEHVEVLLADVPNRGIKSVLESIGDQVVKDVKESLNARGLPPLTEEAKTALWGQIQDMASRDNKVRQLMNNRLMAFMREGSSGRNIGSLQVPKGCTAVQQELAQVLGNFLRLTSHNRSVFGAQYAQIIERLIKPTSNGTSHSEPSGSDGTANGTTGR